MVPVATVSPLAACTCTYEHTSSRMVVGAPSLKCYHSSNVPTLHHMRAPGIREATGNYSAQCMTTLGVTLLAPYLLGWE
jgi:hypothetical protein